MMATTVKSRKYPVNAEPHEKYTTLASHFSSGDAMDPRSMWLQSLEAQGLNGTASFQIIAPPINRPTTMKKKNRKGKYVGEKDGDVAHSRYPRALNQLLWEEESETQKPKNGERKSDRHGDLEYAHGDLCS